MDFSELKFKNQKELDDLLLHKRDELRKLRFDLSQGKVKNVSLVREAKKDIAKILTILNSSKKAGSAATKNN